jgi:hypothetical protein
MFFVIKALFLGDVNLLRISLCQLGYKYSKVIQYLNLCKELKANMAEMQAFFSRAKTAIHQLGCAQFVQYFIIKSEYNY